MANTKNFGEAIEALKNGKRVSRRAWVHPDGGFEYFIFMQIHSEIKKHIVPAMQSLPQSVKDEFQRRFEDESAQIDAIYYNNQLAIVGLSNLIRGWSPSPTEVLAEDWLILD